MAQQTAMQKLLTNLESIGIKIPQGVETVYLKMEKEQIMRAYEFGVADPYNFIEDEAEQYYNETFTLTPQT